MSTDCTVASADSAPCREKHRDVLRVASNGYQNGVELRSDTDIEVSRLAKLNPVEYERERRAVAKRLKVRAPALDRLVAAEREEFYDGGKQVVRLAYPSRSRGPSPSTAPNYWTPSLRAFAGMS